MNIIEAIGKSLSTSYRWIKSKVPYARALIHISTTPVSSTEVPLNRGYGIRARVIIIIIDFIKLFIKIGDISYTRYSDVNILW